MARKKNKKSSAKKAKTKTSSKPQAATRAKAKGKAKAKPRTAKSKAGAARSGSGKKNDVEQRWREYRTCRTDLERAWRTAGTAWKDDAHEQFEKEYIEVFLNASRTSISAMTELSNLLKRVVSQCS